MEERRLGGNGVEAARMTKAPRVHGDLTVMGLADLVAWLGNRKQSGRLTLARGALKRVVDIDSGLVIRVRSNHVRDQFGQFLLHFSLLTEDQLATALQAGEGTDVLLGRVLAMTGQVREEHLIQALRVQFAEVLLDSFRWESGRFLFESEFKSKPKSALEVAVPLIDIHVEGSNRQRVWREYSELIPDESARLSVQDTGDFEPESLDARIVEIARQGKTVEGMALELHARRFNLAARLVSLVRSGKLEVVDPSVTMNVSDLKPSGSNPDTARTALADGRVQEAIRQVDAGLRNDPEEPEYNAVLAELAQATALGETEDLVSVPQRTNTKADRRLSDKEQYLLARADGRRTVEAIVRVSPMHPREGLELIRRLAADGLLKMV